MVTYCPYFSVLLLLFSIWATDGLIKSVPMPHSLSDCFERKTRNLNVTEFPGHAINSFCLNTYKSRDVDVNQKLDVPQNILNWIRSLLRKFIAGRKKRQTVTHRKRKEIRVLTEKERYYYFRAIQALKADTTIAPNKWDALARFHSGNLTIANAHDSSNFFSWHRVFLLVAEEALRTKIPHVTIPYWDSTKDFDMPEPVMSVLWTSKFFGNGDGIVTTGPFGNWLTGDNEPLIRNTGSSGSLMSRQGVQNILSQTFHYEINEGTASRENSLEIQHNAVHNWVDGTMSGLNTAPQDPVFYSHHCFVDYVWYIFRKQQVIRGINPASDYPPTNNTFHQPFFRMVGFEPLRNIDGYSNFWDEIVSYEDSPTCFNSGHCNSLYLHCIDGNCVSKDSSVVGERPGGQMDLMPLSPSMKAAKMMGPLPIGKQFPYFFIDNRTRGDPLPTKKLKKRKKNPLHTFSGHNMGQIGMVLHQLLSSWRSGTAEKLAASEISLGTSLKGKSRSPVSLSSPLKNSFQNTFLLDGVADARHWVYIPIRVIHKRTYNQYFNSKVIQNGHVIGNNDMYMPSDLQMLSHSSSPGTYRKCSSSASVTERVFVQSDGLSYNGRYKDYAIIDGRQPISSALTYIAVKNPKFGQSQAYLSAFDICGRMCHPRCLLSGSNPAQYVPCSGVIDVSSEFPKMFGKTFGEVAYGMWSLDNIQCPTPSNENVYITFYCNYDLNWPWKTCNSNNTHSF